MSYITLCIVYITYIESIHYYIIMCINLCIYNLYTIWDNISQHFISQQMDRLAVRKVYFTTCKML